MERLVVALVNDMPEVCHAKSAETAEDSSRVKILKKRGETAHPITPMNVVENLQESGGPAAVDSRMAPGSRTGFADSGGTPCPPDFLKVKEIDFLIEYFVH